MQDKDFDALLAAAWQLQVRAAFVPPYFSPGSFQPGCSEVEACNCR